VRTGDKPWAPFASRMSLACAEMVLSEIVLGLQHMGMCDLSGESAASAEVACSPVAPPKERYRLVGELHADGVRVRQACYVLDVSASGYYGWKTRPPSARSIRRAWLTDLIGQVHEAS
jgi:hypothetical protein